MTQSTQQQQQSAQQQQLDATRKTASQKQSSSHPMATTEQPMVSVHVASHEEIAERAYGIYTNKGRAKGQCQQNWHQAESELRKQQSMAGGSDYRNTPLATRDGTEPIGKNYDQVMPSAKSGNIAVPAGKSSSSSTGPKNKL